MTEEKKIEKIANELSGLGSCGLPDGRCVHDPCEHEIAKWHFSRIQPLVEAARRVSIMMHSCPKLDSTERECWVCDLKKALNDLEALKDV